MNYMLPGGDDKLRWVCSSCDYIHYENPRIIAGTLPVKDDTILLCKRAIEPRSGKWTLPSGFMENNETLEEGALRETMEETGVEVTINRLLLVFSIPRISQVYMLFLADWKANLHPPGNETEDLKFFHWSDIPWDDIAFSAVRYALEYYDNGRGSKDVGFGIG